MEEATAEFIQKRKERLTYIIDGLKDNEPFRMLLEEKSEAVRFSDSNWHLVDINDKERLLELKYNKLAAESLLRCLDDFKNELDSYDSIDEISSYYNESEYDDEEESISKDI